MTVAALHKRVDKRFRRLEHRIDLRFKKSEQRIDRRFKESEHRTNARFEALIAQMTAGFANVDRRFESVLDKLDAFARREDEHYRHLVQIGSEHEHRLREVERVVGIGPGAANGQSL